MRRWAPLLGLVLAVLLLMAAVPARPAAAQAHVQGESIEGIDVVIVLDDSGSMATCWPWQGKVTTQCGGNQETPTDPLALRYSAARLLIQLADANDRIGVLRFDAAARKLVELQGVGDERHRESLRGQIVEPDDYSTRGYTRIDLGLTEASKMLAGDRDDRPAYVLFLTDGNPSGPEGMNTEAAFARLVRPVMKDLRARGVQVFPVALCNDKGCPDNFLKAELAHDQPVREAKTADDLLAVFSEVFSQMKRTLHVERGLEFSVKAYHGVEELYFITKQGALGGVTRSGQTVPAPTAFEDRNIAVAVTEYANIAQGDWKVDAEGSGFIVARTRTYPDLVQPPPSVEGSSAALHYYAAGRPVFLAAKAVGPVGDEELLLDENTALGPLSTNGKLRYAQVPAGTAQVRLQVGSDTKPLIIRRDYRLAAVKDVPEPQAAVPQCAPNAPCQLMVSMKPGPPISDLHAVVYVSDTTADNAPRYEQEMACTDRQCADSGFKPEDGHRYEIRYLLWARNKDGLRYGDFVETTLSMSPTVYVRGLPETLNLKQQPTDGWPVTVVAGVTEDLGKLRAGVTLKKASSDEPLPGINVEFGADISGRQPEISTALKIAGWETLPPGNYAGKVEFFLDKTPQAETIMPAPVPVVYNPAKPEVTVLSKSVDFPDVPFDPSPNFHLDVEATVKVRFNEQPFDLTAHLDSSSCDGVRLSVVEQGQSSLDEVAKIKLRLQSIGAPTQLDCAGALTLSGPGDDYVVNSGQELPWSVRIKAVDWEILGQLVDGKLASTLEFMHLTDPDDAPAATIDLVVRYTGKPPFNFVLKDSELLADGGEKLAAHNFTLSLENPQRSGDEPDAYVVRLKLTPTEKVPSGGIAGLGAKRFAGPLVFSLAGVPNGRSQTVSTGITSTGWWTRHGLPIAYWVWQHWWLVVLLLAFAWLIRRMIVLNRPLLRTEKKQTPSIESNVPAGPRATTDFGDGLQGPPEIRGDAQPWGSDESSGVEWGVQSIGWGSDDAMTGGFDAGLDTSAAFASGAAEGEWGSGSYPWDGGGWSDSGGNGTGSSTPASAGTSWSGTDGWSDSVSW